MGNCPKCGKVFGAHAVIGEKSDPQVGDVSICIGCGTPLVIVALPYEFRLLNRDDLENMDPGTRLLLARAQYRIEQDVSS